MRKAFIVAENVGDHEADEGEEKIFRAEKGKNGKRAGLIQTGAPLLKPVEARREGGGGGGPTAYALRGEVACRVGLCKWKDWAA